MTGSVDPTNGGRPVDGPGTPPSAGDSARPERTFHVPGPDLTAPQPDAIPSERAHAIHERIQECLSKGYDREKVLADLVRHELTEVFGASVSDAQVQAVAEAVLDDPRLGEVYARLWGMSTGGEGSFPSP